MQGSYFLGVMELRSYHSLRSLGVKPYTREFFRSYGVKELFFRSYGVKELSLALLVGS